MLPRRCRLWDTITTEAPEQRPGRVTAPKLHLTTLFTAFLAGVAASALAAQASDLSTRFAAEQTAALKETSANYALPIGPWADGSIITRRTEGTVETTAWRIETPDLSTLDLLTPLRDDLLAQGYRVLFECETQSCGGFDFRYSTQVLPEPDMHVDLGDFRFVAAQLGSGATAQHQTLLISRSKLAGFVQQVRVWPKTTQPFVQPSSKSSPIIAPDEFTQRLQGGAVALDDLNFKAGAAELADGPFESLNLLARFLAQNPDRSLALVGHTDSSGSLDANKALSQRRAEAVRQRLISQHSIAPNRIGAHGIGYLTPRASNDTEEGRAKNRRVEAMIAPTR